MRTRGYKKEAEIVKKLAFQFSERSENIYKVLDIGCGTGKHDIEMTKI